MANNFKHIPRTAQGHFTLHFFGAIYALLHYVRFTNPEDPEALDASLSEHPFLQGYFAQMLERLPEDIEWRQGLAWWQKQILDWEAGHRLPFVTLSSALGLGFSERIALVMAGLVEEDARFRRPDASDRHLPSPLSQRGPGNREIKQGDPAVYRQFAKRSPATAGDREGRAKNRRRRHHPHGRR